MAKKQKEAVAQETVAVSEEFDDSATLDASGLDALADPKKEGHIRMTVEDLPGVGPATAEKLKECGYEDLMAVAVASPAAVAEKCDIGEGIAQKIINAARKLADVGGFETGL